jgi:predicted metal-dependent peptidase
MKTDRSFLEEYRKAKTVLLTISPFIASLLNKARVVATTAVPIAAVDDHDNILINPEAFTKLSNSAKVFVLAHEVMHWAFRDPERAKTRDHQLWNIVTDAVNNDILLGIFNPGELGRHIVTLEVISGIIGIPEADLRSKSKEEIYRLLESTGAGQGQGQEGDAESGGSGGSGALGDVASGDRMANDLRQGDHSQGGEVIQEGSRDIYDKKDIQERAEAIKRAIAEAEQVQKMRGTLPVGLQRLVDAVLRPKIPWKTLLKQALKDGLGRTSTQSWKKLSRRHRDFPGKKRLVTPTVWVGVDTSGSIGEEELRQFLGEVYGIARASKAKVVVIPWDARMYDPVIITSPSQVRQVAKAMRGGGGTDPTEFLEYVQKHMGHLDAVVILSDGYIGPADAYESIARRIAAKASVCIFATTAEIVQWPSWKSIKVEF